MPAHSKRYYSVKEAAKILGVSTNTIYSYLDKGTLRSKRLGKGRFKIIASDLLPFLGEIEKNIESGAKKFAFLSFLGTDKGYEVKGNFVFWRIYIGYLMLSVGLVHFFWRQNLLISIPLVLSGIFTVYIAEKWEEHKTLSAWVHFIDFLVLTLVSIISFYMGYYYMVVFLGSAALTILLQIKRSVNRLSGEGSLILEYMTSTLIGTGFLVVFLLFIPSFIPFTQLSDFIAQYRFLVVFCIVLFTLPLTYIHYVLLQSHFEKRSHLEFLVLPVYGIASVAVATISTNIGLWDMAFAGFFYAFLTFVVLWLRRVGNMKSYRKEGLLVTFGWLGIAITIGVLSIYYIQAKLKASTLGSISEKNDVVVNNVNEFFTLSESTIISTSNSLNISGTILRNDKAGARDFAKNLYNKLTEVNRVLVYDADGVAIGVYPLSSVTEGTNFSSREYFQSAKSTGKPYLSKIFESVVGSRTVLYAVPIFSGNTFVGEVGVAYNLNALSKDFQTATTAGKIFAYDSTGKYVLNLDTSLLATPVPKFITDNFDKGNFEADSSLVSCESAGVPEWRICKLVALGEVTQVVYITNLVLIIFLFVNAVQSLRAGFSLSEKDKTHI